MPIRDRELYQGAALIKIVEHETFTALNRADEKYGHYIINADKRVLVKYGTERQGERYRFTLNGNDKEVIQNDMDQHDFFLVLVCGEEEICLLTEGQVEELVDLDPSESSWISVNFSEGTKMKVEGQEGDLKNKVARNAFPSDIFD